MNRIKKIASILLALLMVFAMTAMAEGVAKTEVTIDDGTVSGATYEAYKLLNATSAAAGEEGDKDDKFAYTLNDEYTSILQNVTGKTEQADIVAYIAGLNASEVRAFADAVYAAIQTTKLDADATSTENKFELEQGYYLIVESVLGTIENGPTDTYSLVMLDTAGLESVTVKTKEGVPTVEKKVEEKNDSTGDFSWGDSADYDIGDSINYMITGTVSSKYADYKSYYYSFGDTMDAGLTYNEDAKVYVVNGEVKTEVTDQFKIVKTENGFTATSNLKELVLPEGVSISASTTIVVEYSATLNENAVSGTTGNENKVVLEYENNPYHEGDSNPETPDKPDEPDKPGKTPEDVNIVFTFDVSVDKVYQSGTDPETNEPVYTPLEGAGFTLYKWDASVEGADKWVAVGNEITGVTTFEFEKLDEGKYKLVESTVPAGYNKAADVEFEIVSTLEGTVLTGLTVAPADSFTVTLKSGKIETNVVNLSGTELPSTGGMGTTMLYVVGGLLVVGAVVVMISKKKAEEK